MNRIRQGVGVASDPKERLPLDRSLGMGMLRMVLGTGGMSQYDGCASIICSAVIKAIYYEAGVYVVLCQ